MPDYSPLVRCFVWGQDHNYAQAANAQGRLCGTKGTVAIVCPQGPGNIHSLDTTLPPDALAYPTIPGPPRLPGMASMADDDSITNLLKVIDEIRAGRHPHTDFELQIFYAIERNRQREEKERLAAESVPTRFQRIGNGTLD